MVADTASAAETSSAANEMSVGPEAIAVVKAEEIRTGPALSGQLQRIEQAVEAMAIEVERISESQRFMVKLQSETAQRTLK